MRPPRRGGPPALPAVGPPPLPSPWRGAGGGVLAGDAFRTRPVTRPAMVWTARIAAILATMALVAVFWQIDRVAINRPWTAGVDILPLWLGAEAVRTGQDPCDPRVAAAIFGQEGHGMHVGGFINHYPPTAPLLFLPARMLGLSLRQLSPWIRTVLVAAEAVGIALAALASVPRERGAWGLATAFSLTALLLGTRLARIVIPTSQPGPLVVLVVGSVLFALSRSRGGFAGAVVAVGAAIKLAPVVMVAGIWQLRERRGVLGFLAVMLLFTFAYAATGAPFAPGSWLTGVVGFVNQPEMASRAVREGALLTTLCSYRIPVSTVVASGLVALSLRRPPSAALATGAGASSFAAVALIMAGSHHEHEALLVLPLVAWVASWPVAEPRSRLSWFTAISVLSSLLVGSAFTMAGPPDSLRWLGIAYVIAAGVWLRTGILLWSTRPGARAEAAFG